MRFFRVSDAGEKKGVFRVNRFLCGNPHGIKLSIDKMMNLWYKKRVKFYFLNNLGNGVDDLETPAYYRKLLDMAVMAGTIMIASGAETHRVEDTLHRILGTSGFEHAEAFVLTTGLIVTLSDPSSETLSISQRVTDCSQNFGRVADVNAVSRDFCSGKITLDEAVAKLRVIKTKERYNKFLWHIGYILATMGFCITFGGSFLDAFGAFFCGLAVSVIVLDLGPKIGRGFVTTILAAAALTLLATGISYFGAKGFSLTLHTHYIIVGAIMPLVPGLAMTNAFRDILHGDYLASGSRIIEALMVAVCVAIGIGAGMAGADILGLAETLTISLDLSVHNALEFFIAALSSGVAVLGFCLVFKAPPKYLFACSLNAFLAWSVYLAVDILGWGGLWATFFSTLVADVFAYYSARVLKAPVVLFLVAGILPMVPGVGIYQGVHSLIFGGDAASILISAFMSTGVIALAIFVTDTALDIERRIYLNILKWKKKA